MTLVYLALGSNLRGADRQIRQALQRMRSLPKSTLIAVAPLYKSKAFGRKVQPQFCNTVLALQTALQAETLYAICRDIEKKQGRCRLVRWGARSLDIDIILYGRKKITKPKLKIPHPAFLLRDFVLIPLLDIAPNAILPDGTAVSDRLLKEGCCKTLKTN